MSYLEAIRGLLRKINGAMESLWIEREACHALLLSRGVSLDEIVRSELDAKADANYQEEARAAFADVRTALLDSATPAVIEALVADLTPTEKPN